MLAVLPASSVDCERGFSGLSRIKVDNRSLMKDQNLEHLLRVSSTQIEIPELIVERSDTLIGKWRQAKQRRPREKNNRLMMD